MAKNARPYEGVIIIRPEASEETQKNLFKKNKEIIEAHGGHINHIDTWGKRVLANSIGKSRKGIFFHVTFDCDTKCVAELERTMKINESVLRYVHTRLEDGTELPGFVDAFKKELAEGIAREKEREVKLAAKRAARAQGGPGSRME